MSLNKYILMEAAIPSGCFNDAANNYPRFLTREETSPTPDTGEDLGYRLYSTSLNVGKFVSFFNIADFALSTGTIAIPGGAVGSNFGWPYQTNWEQNQLAFKPDRFNALDWQAGDYLYLPNQPLGERVTVNWSPTLGGTYITSRLVTDIHESMAFAARPRSKAAGAEIHNATVFGSVLDLQDACGFGRDVEDHSGQFTRAIQVLNPFYSRLCEELQQ